MGFLDEWLVMTNFSMLMCSRRKKIDLFLIEVITITIMLDYPKLLEKSTWLCETAFLRLGSIFCKGQNNLCNVRILNMGGNCCLWAGNIPFWSVLLEQNGEEKILW